MRRVSGWIAFGIMAITEGCNRQGPPPPAADASTPTVISSSADASADAGLNDDEWAVHECRLREANPNTPLLNRCRSWRMVEANLCRTLHNDRHYPVPSHFNPCACLCDLCANDTECAAKPNGRCVGFKSDLSSESHAIQKTCVYEGDRCYPGASCPKKGETCFNTIGTPFCDKLIQR